MSEIDEKDYERLRNRMQAFNQPSAAPREEMWNAIQPAWQKKVTRRNAKRFRNRTLAYGMAAAAVLVLGVALGRWSAEPDRVAIPVIVRSARPNADARLPYRMAASQHFMRAETLLMTFQVDPAQDDVIPLARNLLTTTRLLLDSRAGEDPALRKMLEDLELVFSQIAVLSPENDIHERDLITESVEDNTLLPRLHNIIPDGSMRIGV